MKKKLISVIGIMGIGVICGSSTFAAFTVTARGTGNGSATPTLAMSPTSTIAAGSMGVLCLSFDNAGSGGSTKLLSNATITDSVGNTWTRRLDFIYDPGAASAGMELGVYTGNITTQVTSSDTVTVTFGTNTNCISAWWQITPGASLSVSYIDGAASCDGCTSGQTGTATTITSNSITSGDAIVGIMAAENVGTMTGDSDSTNGSWNSQQSQTAGSGTSGGKMATQVKVTTGTGTQTYDVTLGTSSDWETGWIQVREVTSSIKTALGLTYASVKTVDDLAIASVKTVEGLQ